jgi:predicted nucleotidyltransferase
MNKYVRVLNNNLKKIDDKLEKQKDNNTGGLFGSVLRNNFEIVKDKLEDITGITEDRKKNGY